MYDIILGITQMYDVMNKENSPYSFFVHEMFQNISKNMYNKDEHFISIRLAFYDG